MGSVFSSMCRFAGPVIEVLAGSYCTSFTRVQQLIGTLCLVCSDLMGIAMFLSSEEYSEENNNKKIDYHVSLCRLSEY